MTAPLVTGCPAGRFLNPPSPKCRGCPAPLLNTQGMQAHKQASNATVGSGYQAFWHTGCSGFAPSGHHLYSPPPQNHCKYQWSCPEHKLQLGLTIPHLLLTKPANTSSCPAAKQPTWAVTPHVTVWDSQHTETHCAGDGDGEREGTRQGVNCTTSQQLTLVCYFRVDSVNL